METKKQEAAELILQDTQLEAGVAPIIAASDPQARQEIIQDSPRYELPEDFELTDELKDAFDIIENSNKNIFITGNAGTGKSTLLKYICRNTKKKFVVLAPTGVGALNVGGQTIHSFFRFPHTFIEFSDIRALSGTQKRLVEEIELIIIDEVSMVRVDLLDAIDQSLRLNRHNPDVPFGGVQVVFVGDTHQLAPVVEESLKPIVARTYKSPYFFDAPVFDKADVLYIELTKQFRQHDNKLIGLLNKIRNKTVTDTDLSLLNGRVSGETLEGTPIVLSMTNAVAEHINSDKLNELTTKECRFEAEISGNFYGEKSYPTAKTLVLKEGAQVMMLRNDPDHRWVNGTMATVDMLADDFISVVIDGEVHDVMRSRWERIEYRFNMSTRTVDKTIMGSFVQFPMKLAWSVTVHKAQGQTFDLVVIMRGTGAFAHGQTYVALSRCRTLEGVYLIYPIEHSDIIFDKRVDGYRQKFIKLSDYIDPDSQTC